MKNKQLYAGIIILILFLSACNNSDTDVETINLAISPIPHSALIFIAQEKGYFAEQGLNVEMIKFSSGKMALDALLGDGVDFATTADFPLTLAGLSDQEVGIIATIGYGDDIKVIARKDAGISEIKDLEGKKIATLKGGGGDFLCKSCLKLKTFP